MLGRRHRLLNTIGDLIGKLLKAKIVKTWSSRSRRFTELVLKIENAQRQFSSGSNFFKTLPKRIHVEKMPRSNLAKRSGSTL